LKKKLIVNLENFICVIGGMGWGKEIFESDSE